MNNIKTVCKYKNEKMRKMKMVFGHQLVIYQWQKGINILQNSGKIAFRSK